MIQCNPTPTAGKQTELKLGHDCLKVDWEFENGATARESVQGPMKEQREGKFGAESIAIVITNIRKYTFITVSNSRVFYIA